MQLDLIDDYHDQMTMMAYSFMAWMVSFLLLHDRVVIERFCSQRQVEVLNRVVSIFHGQICFWGAVNVIINTNSFQEKNSYNQQLLMLVSSGYFFYDTLVCVYYDLYDYWLVFHHVVSIIAFWQSLFSGQNGLFVTYGILITETSNLYMHVRYLIAQFGYRQTKIYELFENIYFALFILFRGVLTPIYLYICNRDINVHYMLKLSSVALLCYSYYYIFEMVRIIKRKIRHSRDRLKKGITLQWFRVVDDLKGLKETRDPIL